MLGSYEYGTRSGRSTADVVRDIIGDVQDIIRSEVKLAKAELREEMTETIGGAKMLGAAAVAGLFALGFVLLSVASLLANVMPTWGANLMVGIVLLIAAGAACLRHNSHQIAYS